MSRRIDGSGSRDSEVLLFHGRPNRSGPVPRCRARPPACPSPTPADRTIERRRLRPTADRWDSAGMPFAAEEVPWTEIPAVRLFGLVVGGLLLIAAIRAMFGGKGRR